MLELMCGILFTFKHNLPKPVLLRIATTNGLNFTSEMLLGTTKLRPASVEEELIAVDILV